MSESNLESLAGMENDSYQLVKDIPTPKLIRDTLQIPLDFYERTEKITDPETKRIVEYRIFVGERITKMFNGIVTEYKELLSQSGEVLNPWDNLSVLKFDDFLAKGDYLKKKLHEFGLLKDIEETNDLVGYYFAKSGVVESLYELIISQELIEVAIEQGYFSRDEQTEALLLLPPASDTLSRIFLKRSHVSQRKAIALFKERMDLEKREKLWVLFNTGFVLGKRLIASTVNGSFSRKDVVDLADQFDLDSTTSAQAAINEYFQMLLEGRETSTIELPPLLKQRVASIQAGGGVTESDHSPRCDITHAYPMNHKVSSVWRDFVSK